MPEMSGRIPLIEALEAVDDAPPEIQKVDQNQQTTIIFQAGESTTPTTTYNILPRGQPGAAVNVVNSSPMQVSSSVNPIQKMTITPLVRKPLKGTTNGLLLPTSSVYQFTASPATTQIALFPQMGVPIISNGFQVSNSTVLVQTPVKTVTITTPVSIAACTTPQTSTPIRIGTINRNQLKLGQISQSPPACRKKLICSVITCNSCGLISKTFQNCDKCGKPISQEKKIYVNIEKAGAQSPEASKEKRLPTLNKKFYSCKNISPSAKPQNGNVIKKTYRKAPKRKLEPPECLTISDDDEEESMDTSNNDSTLPLASETPQEEEGRPPTPLGDAPSTPNGLTDGKDGKADQEGCQSLHSKVAISDIELKCRTVKVGSYKATPKRPVIFWDETLIMALPCVGNTGVWEEISIAKRDVVSVLGHFGKHLPMLIYYINRGLAASIRQKLRMTSKDGPYFDPDSTDETQKRIIFLIDEIDDVQHRFIKAAYGDSFVFDTQGTSNGTSGNLKLSEIDQKEANHLLVKSTCTKIVKDVNKMCISIHRKSARSPAVSMLLRSPVIIPLNKVKGDVVKMITYPRPPETGGITVTSEDFSCLEPGEFLNDVIIDFYLKYVMLERLTPENKMRTHIFSSFFYGRLTNSEMPTQSPSIFSENDKPFAVRRHSRVKTWTRHVDIFSKDFIIIPINENSHWFLAIICYPYLLEKVRESSAESLAKKLKETRSSMNSQSESVNDENAKVTEEKVPVPKTPRRRLPSDFCASPCILIFDSLHGRNWARITGVLREYLKVEWKLKRNSDRAFNKDTIPGGCPTVPQQANYSDCGAYLLQFVDSFFEKPIQDFVIPIRGLQTWFSDEVVGRKRQDLKDLILRLQSERSELDTKTEAAACSTAGSNCNSSVESVPEVNPPESPADAKPASSPLTSDDCSDGASCIATAGSSENLDESGMSALDSCDEANSDSKTTDLEDFPKPNATGTSAILMNADSASQR